jgi:plasmid stabilization system protein ParE
MGEIKWTEAALHWLRDIHDYIAVDNAAAADSVVSGIYEKAQMLCRYPHIGHLYRTEAEGEIRILLYGHYRITYFLRTSGIDILGVFHGALDIERYLE